MFLDTRFQIRGRAVRADVAAAAPAVAAAAARVDQREVAAGLHNSDIELFRRSSPSLNRQRSSQQRIGRIVDSKLNRDNDTWKREEKLLSGPPRVSQQPDDSNVPTF